MAWLTKLHAAQAATHEIVDPWLLPLGRLRGKHDYDGLERVLQQAGSGTSTVLPAHPACLHCRPACPRPLHRRPA
jgi:hypothetical protein